MVKLLKFIVEKDTSYHEVEDMSKKVVFSSNPKTELDSDFFQRRVEIIQSNLYLHIRTEQDQYIKSVH